MRPPRRHAQPGDTPVGPARPPSKQGRSGPGRLDRANTAQAIAQLQRTAGNRATTALLIPVRPAGPVGTDVAPLVQRDRVPSQAELALLLPAAGANLPAHLRGLDQVVRNVMTETDPVLGLTAAERTAVETRARGALSAAGFAALSDQERLTRLAEAIEHFRPDRVVQDPGLMRSGARPATTDAANIATLVSNVGILIDDILAASDIDLWLGQIFGAGNGGIAKRRYQLAKVFLNQLAARNKILSDRSGYSLEADLGGTTIAGSSIELTPPTIDNPGTSATRCSLCTRRCTPATSWWAICATSARQGSPI